MVSTIELSRNWDSVTIGNAIKDHIGILRSQGFIVEQLYHDEERGIFATRSQLNDIGIEMIAVAKGDHVGVA